MDSSIKPQKSDASTPDTVDERRINLIRFLLAVSALIIIFMDPTEPNRLVEITYTVLVLYCFYSLVLYFLVIRFPSLNLQNFIHWIDLMWYLVLISLSSGTSSIFLFFFFFSILVTAFRLGYHSGLNFTFAATVLFTIVGYLTAPSEPAFELNRFLLRPTYLLILGYLISFWGGREIASKKRLALLKDINKLSNPRLGINQAFELMMTRLLNFYQADRCLMITDLTSSKGYTYREIDSDSNWTLDTYPLLSPLIEVPGRFGLLYKARAAFWKLNDSCERLDFATGKKEKIPRNQYQVLTDILETRTLITVPIILHSKIIGRIYLTSQRNIFDFSDLEFLRQAIEQILPTIKNIQLLEKMASTATFQQRQKISRDIHDSIIQPFISLKLGLESLEIKYCENDSVKNDLEKVTQLANSSINDLRQYISRLNSSEKADGSSVLLSAVKEQIARYVELYDLQVTLSAAEDFYLSDRLSAEVFHIIVEGLSNIVRHTESKKAFLKFEQNSSVFSLEIKNEVNIKPETFFPKSLIGRVEDLGGTVKITNNDHSTVIVIEIPL